MLRQLIRSFPLSFYSRNFGSTASVLPSFTKRDIQEKVIGLVLDNSHSSHHDSLSLQSNLALDLFMEEDDRASLYFEALEEFQIHAPSNEEFKDFTTVSQVTDWISSRLQEEKRLKLN